MISLRSLSFVLYNSIIFYIFKNWLILFCILCLHVFYILCISLLIFFYIKIFFGLILSSRVSWFSDISSWSTMSPKTFWHARWSVSQWALLVELQKIFIFKFLYSNYFDLCYFLLIASNELLIIIHIKFFHYYLLSISLLKYTNYLMLVNKNKYKS